MHHTRRTHNAHNETQKRLERIASCYRSKTPHYTVVTHKYGTTWVEPYWSKFNNSFTVGCKIHNAKKGYAFHSEYLEENRKHSFYVKSSKSNGKNSTYKLYKKTLHKKWRKKGVDEPSYTIRNSHLSYSDYIF